MKQQVDRLLFWELITLIAGIFFIFKVQFSVPYLFDADGYLHIRMADFLRHRGLERTFPWTQFTIFCQNFSDKDFIFHALLIPFTFFKDIFLGAKWAGALFFSGSYVMFYWFLRQWSDRRFIALFLILYFFSTQFIFALNSIRPFTLIVVFSYLAILFLAQQRTWPLFWLTLIYSFTHLSAPYMLIFAFFVEMSRFFTDHRIVWKNFTAIGAGMIAGILFHPYFPNNLEVFFQNGIMVPFYAIKTGVLELGAEFFPTTTRECLFRLAVVWAGLFACLTAYIFSWVKPKTTLITRSLFVFSLFFIIMGFISQRSFIHGWPIFLLFFASFIKDVLEQERESKKIIFRIYFCVILFCVPYSLFLRQSLDANINSVRFVNGHYEDMAAYMRENFPKKELIFTSNWSDPQYFIGLNPDDYYFVTLDPVYMYSWNQQKYMLYRDISLGRTKDPYKYLKEGFNIHYGYVGKYFFNNLAIQIRNDSRFEILKEDRLGMIFKLKEQQ